MSNCLWYAGTLRPDGRVELPGHDPALLYGASVFTTLRVYQDSLEHPLVYWPDHCDRITQSLHAFGWPNPDWDSVYRGCNTLKNHYPVLRVTIFADGRELITGRPLPADLHLHQRQGITAWVAPAQLYQRTLPAHKTGNYLSNWLAWQTACAQGAQAAILTDSQGHWLETHHGTLWGWRQGQWWTPPLSAGILPGIVRQRLIAWLRGQRLAVQEAPWSPELAPQFEALACTNCVIEVVPLRTVLLPTVANGQTTLEYDPCHPGLETLRSLFAGKQAEC